MPSWKQIQKWVYFDIWLCMFPFIVFYLYVYIFFGDLFKIILHLSFCIALWDINYMHLGWQDIENDLNRIVEF